MKPHVGTAQEGIRDGCWILRKTPSCSVTGFHLSSGKAAGFSHCWRACWWESTRPQLRSMASAKQHLLRLF